jgi:hypothetical protein
MRKAPAGTETLEVGIRREDAAGGGGATEFADNHDYVLNLLDVVILGDREGYRERNQRQ